MDQATIKHYFELEQKIHEHFGYEEQYRHFPLVNALDLNWFITNDQNGTLYYSEKNTQDFGEYCSADIYTQRHLTKWVYRQKQFTLALAATGCDGNIFLFILDNNKEQKTKNTD